MKKTITTIIIIDIFCFVLIALILGVSNNYSKKKLVTTFSEFVRNDVILNNQRNISIAALNFIHLNEFKKIEVGEVNLINKEGRNSFLFEISEKIYFSDRDQENVFTVVKVKYSLFPVLLMSLLLWGSLNLLTIPFIPVIRKRIRDEEYKKTEELRLQKEAEFLQGLAHDLKSPISTIQFLNSEFDNLNLMPDDFQSIFNNAISRMNYISNSLLKKSNTDLVINTNEKNFYFNFKSLIDEFRFKVNAKFVVDYGNAEQNLKDIVFLIPNSELIRIIVNIMNNSVESFKGNDNKIIINFNIRNDFLIIDIKDNGVGISKENLSNLFKKGNTFGKGQSGNGLGLYFAKKILNEHESDISITSEESKYTNVQLSIKLLKDNCQEILHHVLLDNDELVKLTWENFYKKRNLHLDIYSDFAALLLNLDNYPINTKFFIDYNLNDKLNGLDVVNFLYDKGYREFYLVTGVEKEKFDGDNRIKGVSDKKPF